jgi:hypothetical protein
VVVVRQRHRPRVAMANTQQAAPNRLHRQSCN